MAGSSSERAQFGEYVHKNISLKKFSNNWKMSMSECAFYIRSILAEAIRQGPYQVNCLLGGIDHEGPSLYWLDYLGTCQKMNFGAHGYAGYFISSVLNNFWEKDMDLEKALECVKYCINELKVRFLVSQESFIVKYIGADGVRLIEL